MPSPYEIIARPHIRENHFRAARLADVEDVKVRIPLDCYLNRQVFAKVIDRSIALFVECDLYSEFAVFHERVRIALEIPHRIEHFLRNEALAAERRHIACQRVYAIASHIDNGMEVRVPACRSCIGQEYLACFTVHKAR